MQSRSVLSSALSGTTNNQRVTMTLLLCGVICPFVFAPFVIWAGRVTPGYSQIGSTFSDSAAQGQPHPEIIGTGLLLLGILLGSFALGCARVLPRLNRMVALSILVTAFAIAGTGMFHDYSRSPAVPRNLEGFLHNLFATIAILSAVVAILLSGFAGRRQSGWSHLFGPSFAFAAALAAGYLFQTSSDSWDGLAERGFAAIALSWMVLVAATALWRLDLIEYQSAPVTDRLLADPLPLLDQASERLTSEPTLG